VQIMAITAAVSTFLLTAAITTVSLVAALHRDASNRDAAHRVLQLLMRHKQQLD
jgi:hypothetical protein